MPGPPWTISDTFTRANSAVLGTADTGQNWVTIAGATSPQILGNKAAPQGAGECGAIITDPALGRMVNVQIGWTSDPVSGEVMVFWSSDGTGNNAICVDVQTNFAGGHNFTSFWKTGGGFTQLGNTAAAGFAVNTSYLLDFYMAAEETWVFLSGLLIAHSILPGGGTFDSLAAGRYVGFRHFVNAAVENGGSRITSFKVANL